MKQEWIDLDIKTTVRISEIAALTKDVNGHASVMVQGKRFRSSFYSHRQLHELLRKGKITPIDKIISSGKTINKKITKKK